MRVTTNPITENPAGSPTIRNAPVGPHTTSETATREPSAEGNATGTPGNEVTDKPNPNNPDPEVEA